MVVSEHLRSIPRGGEISERTENPRLREQSYVCAVRTSPFFARENENENYKKPIDYHMKVNDPKR